MSDKSSVKNEASESKSELTDAKIQEMIPTKQIIKEIENPPPQVEDFDEKQRLIFKIQRYQDSRRFGHIVREQLKFNQSFDELNEMPIENLQNLVSRIRIHLDNKNLDRFYDSMVKSGAVAYEQIVTPFYDIEGFADMLTENEDFWCFERFKIEHNFPSVDPTTQMIYMIAQTTLLAHHLLREYENEPEPIQNVPSPEEVIAQIEKGEKTLLPSTTNYTLL